MKVIGFSSRIPPCFRCGRIKECRIGGAYYTWGEKAHTMKITPDLFRRWEDDSETMGQIEGAAEKLRGGLG